MRVLYSIVLAITSSRSSGLQPYKQLELGAARVWGNTHIRKLKGCLMTVSHLARRNRQE